MITANKIDFTGQRIYVGLDVHRKNWSVSVQSKYGEYKVFSQPPDPDKLVDFLHRQFPGARYHSVYEAGYCGYWIHERLTRRGIDNCVVNPADVPTKDQERHRKRDRVDCRKLARNLRNGDLKGIYVPCRSTLEDRTLIRTRLNMRAKETRCKNQIKAMLAFYGVTLPEQQEMGHWSRRFIQWVESIRLERASGNQALQAYLEELGHLRQILAKLNRAILALARTEPYRNWVTLLRSIPGISVLTAMMLLTELGEIRRFPNLDALCSFVGLIPDVESSGEEEHVGPMTQRRHGQLRWILIEASWTAIRKDAELQAAFDEYRRRMLASKAIVKIARKLLNRVRYVLKHEAPCRRSMDIAPTA